MDYMKISESEILSTIKKVLSENRKVIKTGNSTAPQMAAPAPMPPASPAPDMGNEMPQQNGDMGMQSDNIPDMGGEGASDENQFDTNFDAGVEADEDSDPKHYIQQLTGKLSQKLNSFNDEQGGDKCLSKYVASMIITAACKNLEEKDKKELIDKINSASSDEPSNDEGGDDEQPMPDDMGDDTMGGEDEMIPDENPQQDMPMNECRIMTVRELKEMLATDNMEQDSSRPQGQKKMNNVPKAWKSKF